MISGQEAAIQKLIGCIKDAVSPNQKVGSPKFDEVKVRWNLGKDLFFKGPTDGMTLTVDQLQVRHLAQSVCFRAWHDVERLCVVAEWRTHAPLGCAAMLAQVRKER
jgi:hypothetical protein